MRIHLPSWLLYISLIQILITVVVSGQCLDDQRRLLLQLQGSLKFDLNSSTKLVKWNQSSVECCKWDGVGCDSAGRVIILELENEMISDGIENSTALFGLRYLQKLNLAFNMFKSAQIPKGLANLTSLEYLNLSNAGFGGQVPVELSTLRSLAVLDLSTLFPEVRSLRLENPNLQMLVQNLSGLSELYLDSVNISASRSDWCQVLSSSLPNLTILSLRSCWLSGPLDSLEGLHSLSVLRLDGNNISAGVPEFIAQLGNLTTLTLGNCNMLGKFPELIFQVPSLQTLDLSNNKLLNGTIPQIPLTNSFTTFVLSYTNFSGLLPYSIGNLRMLSRIELSNCKFNGTIPPSISNLTQLTYLDFSFNSFIGSIPPFSNSSKLTYLDLSRNSLTGPLSSKHFEGLSKLVTINLGTNSLSGTVPHLLFGLLSLQTLQLSDNRFSGQIDDFSILNTSVLQTVDLSINRLSGSISDSFFKLEGLRVLSLSSNLLSGTLMLEKIQRLGSLTRLELGYNKLSVDASVLGFPQLRRLDLASCNLTSFPDLRNQSQLVYLDLSNNHITGEIPRWIWSIRTHLNLSCNHLVGIRQPVIMSASLSVVDLHSNRLRGELPVPPESAVYVDYSSNNFQQPIPVNILSSTSFLTFFSIANSSLEGTIPASLCNAVVLQVLDLSNNNLSGTIPPCLLANLTTTLGVLDMKRNNIRGYVPDSFTVNCSLKTIDLSDNKLGGTIPPSMANCKELEVVNLGNNNIDGTFPCWLKNSTSLRVLVLRSNNFHGDLGCFGLNESWPNLQIIDIASNNFSGELHPGCITSWRGMMLEDGADWEGNHLRFEYLNLSNYYYQDAVTVTIKGLEMELLKILTVFTAIDFSSNHFTGAIPKTVGDLTSLYLLNLSYNSFSGGIPSSIGNLTRLESLDFSTNQLTGRIPEEFKNLNFLSVLNLSYNKLVGRIPQGAQFQTFSEWSFAGNLGLCGLPLNTSCSSTNPSANPTRMWNDIDFDWQFIVTGLGYGAGASLILAPLVFCKQWREKCDEQTDQFLKMICPGYGFSYLRCDVKVESIENYKDEITDEDDDDEDDDKGGTTQSGKYCVFCTKLDSQIKAAIHSPTCTCHRSHPRFSSTSSSSSLLVVYR